MRDTPEFFRGLDPFLQQTAGRGRARTFHRAYIVEYQAKRNQLEVGSAQIRSAAVARRDALRLRLTRLILRSSGNARDQYSARILARTTRISIAVTHGESVAHSQTKPKNAFWYDEIEPKC